MSQRLWLPLATATILMTPVSGRAEVTASISVAVQDPLVVRRTDIEEPQQLVGIWVQPGQLPSVRGPFDFKSKGDKRFNQGGTSVIPLPLNQDADLELWRMTANKFELDPKTLKVVSPAAMKERQWSSWDHRLVPPLSSRRLHAVIRFSRPVEAADRTIVHWTLESGGMVQPPVKAKGSVELPLVRVPKGYQDCSISKEVVIRDLDYDYTFRLSANHYGIGRFELPKTIPDKLPDLVLEAGPDGQKRRYTVVPDLQNPLRWYYVPQALSLRERKLDGKAWPELSLLRYAVQSRTNPEALDEGATLSFALRVQEDNAVAHELTQQLLQRSPSLLALTRGKRVEPEPGDPLALVKYPNQEGMASYHILQSYWSMGVLPPLEVVPLPIEWAGVDLVFDKNETLALTSTAIEGALMDDLEGSRFSTRLSRQQADVIANKLFSAAGVHCRVRYLVRHESTLRVFPEWDIPAGLLTSKPTRILPAMFHIDPTEIVDDWLNSLAAKKEIFNDEARMLNLLREERDRAAQHGYQSKGRETAIWTALDRRKFNQVGEPDLEVDRKRLETIDLAVRYLLWIHSGRRLYRDPKLMLPDKLDASQRARILAGRIPHFKFHEKELGSPMLRVLTRQKLRDNALADRGWLGFLSAYQFRLEMPQGEAEEALVRSKGFAFHHNSLLERLARAEELFVHHGASVPHAEELRSLFFPRGIPTPGLRPPPFPRPALGVKNDRAVATDPQMIRALFAFEGHRRSVLGIQSTHQHFAHDGFISLAGYPRDVTDRLVMAQREGWKPASLVLPEVEEKGWPVAVDRLQIRPTIEFDRGSKAQQELATKLLERFHKLSKAGKTRLPDQPGDMVETEDSFKQPILRISYAPVRWTKATGWQQQGADPTQWRTMATPVLRFLLDGLEDFGDEFLRVNFLNARFALKYTLQYPGDAFTYVSVPDAKGAATDKAAAPLEWDVLLKVFQGNTHAPTPSEYIDVVLVDPGLLTWSQIDPEDSKLTAVEVKLQQGGRLISAKLQPVKDKQDVAAPPRPLAFLVRRPLDVHGLVWPEMTFTLTNGRKGWVYNADPKRFHEDHPYRQVLRVTLTDANWR